MLSFARVSKQFGAAQAEPDCLAGVGRVGSAVCSVARRRR